MCKIYKTFRSCLLVKLFSEQCTQQNKCNSSIKIKNIFFYLSFFECKRENTNSTNNCYLNDNSNVLKPINWFLNFSD